MTRNTKTLFIKQPSTSSFQTCQTNSRNQLLIRQFFMTSILINTHLWRLLINFFCLEKLTHYRNLLLPTLSLAQPFSGYPRLSLILINLLIPTILNNWFKHTNLWNLATLRRASRARLHQASKWAVNLFKKLIICIIFF